MKVVQVHPDTDSFEFHMGVVRERGEQAYAETLDATTSVEVYGSPSDGILEMLRQQAGAGVALSVTRDYLGGFSRAGTA